jgi:hypothetical protein
MRLYPTVIARRCCIGLGVVLVALLVAERFGCFDFGETTSDRLERVRQRFGPFLRNGSGAIEIVTVDANGQIRHRIDVRQTPDGGGFVRDGFDETSQSPGRRLYLFTWKMGSLDGPYQVWDSEGRTTVVGAFRDGRPTGEWLVYDSERRLTTLQFP